MGISYMWNELVGDKLFMINFCGIWAVVAVPYYKVIFGYSSGRTGGT